MTGHLRGAVKVNGKVHKGRSMGCYGDVYDHPCVCKLGTPRGGAFPQCHSNRERDRNFFFGKRAQRTDEVKPTCRWSVHSVEWCPAFGLVVDAKFVIREGQRG